MEGIMDTNTLDTPLVNTPGRLAIKNGRVHMLKPRGYGSWPVIIPGENVEILYEDQLVTGPKIKSISVCKIPRLDELSVLG